MRNIDLRGRILAVLGATGIASMGLAACGSDTEPSPGAEASDAAAERTGDAQPRDALDDLADTDASDGAEAQAPGDGGGGDANATIRRPFLVGAAMRSAPGARRDDWLDERIRCLDDDAAPGLDLHTRRQLARAWRDDGLQEHASVAAFARFSMMLLGVGAPPDLVLAAQRASIDEIAHAQACFSLARRYGAEDAGPGPLEVHDALSAFSLADAVALTAEEGCVGETLGVALATEQLRRATDPVVRRVLARIIDDEARHADLAWRFVAWAIGQDASTHDAALAAARRAIDATLRMKIRAPDGDAAAWSAHGRLTCAEARAASAVAIREVIEPCLGALGHARARPARSPGPPQRPVHTG